MSALNLAGILGHHADRFPDRPCHTFLDKRTTVRKIGSVGKACLHLEVAIWGEDDRPVPGGMLGEIVLRGPKVFKAAQPVGQGPQAGLALGRLVPLAELSRAVGQ